MIPARSFAIFACCSASSFSRAAFRSSCRCCLIIALATGGTAQLLDTETTAPVAQTGFVNGISSGDHAQG